MKRAIVLLSLALSSSAMAKNPEWFTDGAASVELEGQVDVPLLRGITTGGAPVFEIGGAPDDEGVVPRRLATFSLGGASFMTESVVEEFGGKVKSGRDGAKFAIIPELHIGDLTLRDLRVQVGEGDTDARIALPALKNLVSAYLPSQGVLRFAPAGEDLASAVAAPVSFEWASSKKQFEHGARITDTREGFYVEGQVGDASGFLMLNTGGSSSVDPAFAPAKQSTNKGMRMVSVAMTAGGVTFADVPASIDPAAWSGNDELPYLGTLGDDALFSSDIAIDADAETIAIKFVAAPKWLDATETSLEIAKADFDAAAEPACEEGDEDCAMDDAADSDAADSDAADSDAADSDAEGDEADDGPDEGEAKEVARHTAYAEALEGAGKQADALEYRRLATTFAGETCAPYLAYGNALVVAGKLDEAAPMLKQAGELYERWASQPLDVRLAVGRDDGPEDAYTLKQDASCADAWGDLASLKLRQGDHAGVEALFRAHMDLDSDMAKAYGVSLLQQQKWSEANGAFRRAVNLGEARDTSARLGVGVANAKAGDVAIFDEQVDRLLESTSNAGGIGAILTVAFSDELKGDGAGLAFAQRLVDGAPSEPGNWLVFAAALPPDGKGRVDALAKAKALLDGDQMAPAGFGRLQHERAWLQALSGDAKAAQATVAGLAADGPGCSGYAFFVRSEIARVAGDEAGQAAALKSLHELNPTIPLPAAWKF